MKPAYTHLTKTKQEFAIMDLIKPGYEVLYIWNSTETTDIEQQVNEIKKVASVKLENSERISFGKKCLEF